jgi:hypothetical protein
MCFNSLCKAVEQDGAGWTEYKLKKDKKISFCDGCNQAY